MKFKMGMKKILIATILLVSSCALGYTQTKSHKMPHLVAGAMLESTISGYFAGGYVGVNVSPKLHFGAFYEDLITNEQIEFNENFVLYGLYGEITLYQEEKLGVHALLRGGIKNDKFVFVIPSIVTEWSFNEWFQINILAGVRNQYPAIGLFGQLSIPLKK